MGTQHVRYMALGILGFVAEDGIVVLNTEKDAFETQVYYQDAKNFPNQKSDV